MTKRCICDATQGSIGYFIFFFFLLLPVFLILKADVTKLAYYTFMLAIGYNVGYCVGCLFYKVELKLLCFSILPVDIIFVILAGITNTPIKCLITIILFSWTFRSGLTEGQLLVYEIAMEEKMKKDQ